MLIFRAQGEGVMQSYAENREQARGSADNTLALNAVLTGEDAEKPVTTQPAAAATHRGSTESAK